MRQEAGDKLRVTVISPGFTRTNFAESMTNPDYIRMGEALNYFPHAMSDEFAERRASRINGHD